MALIHDNIKTYDNFRVMENNSVLALERSIARAPTKLKEVHAIRVNEILSNIKFIKTSNKNLADNLTQWNKSHFRKWERNGKQTNITVQVIGNQATAIGATTATQDK